MEEKGSVRGGSRKLQGRRFKTTGMVEMKRWEVRTAVEEMWDSRNADRRDA